MSKVAVPKSKNRNRNLRTYLWLVAWAALAQFFSTIDEQTKAAIARGEPADQARKNIKIDDIKKQIIGDSSVRRVLFSFYGVSPSIAAVYREAGPKK